VVVKLALTQLQTAVQVDQAAAADILQLKAQLVRELLGRAITAAQVVFLPQLQAVVAAQLRLVSQQRRAVLVEMVLLIHIPVQQ
jgi:hypothetical protein